MKSLILGIATTVFSFHLHAADRCVLAVDGSGYQAEYLNMQGKLVRQDGMPTEEYCQKALADKAALRAQIGKCSIDKASGFSYFNFLNPNGQTMQIYAGRDLAACKESQGDYLNFDFPVGVTGCTKAPALNTLTGEKVIRYFKFWSQLQFDRHAWQEPFWKSFATRKECLARLQPGVDDSQDHAPDEFRLIEDAK